MSDLDPHPPTRQCNCPKCLASFDETALDPENVAAVMACLCDDAAMLRDAHPEAANNMDAAATLIERLFERLAKPAELEVEDFLPEAERGALEKIYKAMARKLYAKYLEGTSGFDTASAQYLSQLLRRHVDKGDPVDVANFCAFLLHNGDRISPAPAATTPAQQIASFELLQRQPPKGWGVYRLPEDGPDWILITTPQGEGLRVLKTTDQLLFELASAMLPPPAPEISL